MQPVFGKGERIRAPFELECTNALSLIVSNHPGGVGDPRDADVFVIETTPEQRAHLDQLALRPIKGIVEITGKATNGGSNTWRYPAKLIQYEPMNELNPLPEEVGQMPDGSPVTLEGTVLRVSPTEIEMKTPGGHRFIVDLTLWEQVPTFVGSARSQQLDVLGKVVEPEDHVRLKGVVRDGRVCADLCRSAYLVGAGKGRIDRHNKMRERVDAVFKQVEDALTEKNYAKARKLLGPLAKKALLKEEWSRFKQLRHRFPREEMPVASEYLDFPEVREARKKLGVDFYKLSAGELIPMIQRWAEGTYLTPEGIWESYLLTLGNQVLSLRARHELADHAMTTRLAFLEGDAGQSAFREIHEIQSTIDYLVSRPTPQSINTLLNHFQKVATNESNGWNYSHRLTNRFAEQLYEAQKRIEKMPPQRAQMLKTALKKRLAHIKEIRETLGLIGLQEENPPINATVIGHHGLPLEQKTNPHPYATELKYLNLVIEKLDN